MADDASIVRAGDALLTGRGTQLSLIEGVDDAGLPAQAYARTEALGRFTGERLFSENPRLYKAIVKLLARDVPYREIAEVCEVSVNTVCGVAHREKQTIETLSEALARLGFDVSRLSLEALFLRLSDPEQVKLIPAKDLAVIHGVATQNAQLLAGRATGRIEHSVAAPPDHAAYLDYIRNVTATAPQTGLPAGNPAPNAALPGAPDGPALDVPASPSTPPENAHN